MAASGMQMPTATFIPASLLLLDAAAVSDGAVLELTAAVAITATKVVLSSLDCAGHGGRR